MNRPFTETPAHWRTIRLKQTVAACRNGVWGDEPRGDSNDIICVRVADFDRQALRVSLENPTMRAVPEQARQTKRLLRGDLLIEKSGGGDTQPVGVVVLYDHDRPAVCSNFIARMTPAPGFDPAYLCYLHAALYAIGINRRSILQTTGIQNLDSEQYLSETVRVPDLAEQRSIARFLDRRFAILDALLCAKERLIELFIERRRALISGAIVNKAMTPLKFIRSGALLYGATEPAVFADRDCPRYIRITDLNDDGTLRDDTFQSLPENLARPYLLEDGDILLARSGATVGKAFRYRREWGRACFAGYLIRLRPDRRKVLPDYLHYFTQSHAFQEQVRAHAVQSTIANVSAERYGKFLIPLPALEEQRRIIQTLDRQTSATRKLIAHGERQIERIREYRQGLICCAVTRGLLAVTAVAPAETATTG